MLPYAEDYMPLVWKFQQDNDKNYSKIGSERKMSEWPSQSPDVNPIENLWSELKRQIFKQASSNKTQLWENIEKAWYNIPIET